MKQKRGRKPKPGPREPSGRPSRMSKETQALNMRPALLARAHHAGQPVTEATLLAMRQPWMGCNAGRAIASEPDAPELWQRILTIRKRRAAWLRVIEAPSEHAATAKLGDKPPPGDENETDAMGPDTRTDREREREAESAWSAIVSALFAEDPLLVRYIERAVVLDMEIKGPLASVLRIDGLVNAIGG